MNDEEAVQIVHERTERYREVMRAYNDGAEIQVRYKDPVGDEPIGWRDASCPIWSWFDCEYRVKPKPREWWLDLRTNEAFCTRAFAEINHNAGPQNVVHLREVIE